jgi:hypothetical protein
MYASICSADNHVGHRRNIMSSILSRKIWLSALAFAVLALEIAQMSGSAQAYQCKNSSIQVETIATLKTTSKSNGRSLWTTTVKNSLGLQWSVWNIANTKSQTCEFTSAKWYCVTKAKPCLYVVQ